MLENLSRARSSLLFGVWGECLLGLCEGEEDGRCGDDLEIVADENEVDLSLTGKYVDEFDKFDVFDWNFFFGPIKEPACLLGEICLPGDPVLPLVEDDLFLSIECATTPDPLPVYNLSPMDMIITIWVTRLDCPPLPFTVHITLPANSQGTASSQRWGIWNVTVCKL